VTPGTGSAATAPAGAGLLAKLMATVRAQFRVDVYLPDPEDPVLGRPLCSVPDCDRSGWEYQLCGGHATRWRAKGRPDLPSYRADPGPPLRGRVELTACSVPGCRYGIDSLGLCLRHRGYYARSGHPDPTAWAAELPAVPDGDHGQCGLPFCALWVEHSRHLFCRSHQNRWRLLGSPAVDDFIDHCLTRGKARIDFRGLAPQLKLEFQYAVQCRYDEKSITAPPPVVKWAIRIAMNAGVSSLLDHDEDRWRELTASKSSCSYQGFIVHARTVVEVLRDGAGWDVEYPRDIWRLHTLPGLTMSPGKISTARNHLRFDRITQPWLRSLSKRWCRLRLTSGLTIGTVVADVIVLTRFSRFLDQVTPKVDSLAGVDRPLLERYLAWIADQPGSYSLKEDAVTCINTFFQAIRQHAWDSSLPTTAVFFTGDTPRRPPRLSRRLSEHVMAQIESSSNLDRWPHPQFRLLTLILIRCGLRASDACTLDFDCVIHDGQGAPYLRYLNHKMRREAAVPIDEELQAQIRTQQTQVATRWPKAHPHLFPALSGNAGGQRVLTYDSYRRMLIRWLQICDIRDENGDLVHLTPHQWRHTFASRLINRDVPQEVIRVLLDHESTEMTAHYARITDQTVRRRWEQATKVNVQGEAIVIDPDGPLAQAQWAKTRYGIATQTLPHGYCGLPVQQSCPHANACLTCPVFITGPEFLPELREHRGRTLTLIQTAEPPDTAGWRR
jgi:integrase